MTYDVVLQIRVSRELRDALFGRYGKNMSGEVRGVLESLVKESAPALNSREVIKVSVPKKGNGKDLKLGSGSEVKSKELEVKRKGNGGMNIDGEGRCPSGMPMQAHKYGNCNCRRLGLSV